MYCILSILAELHVVQVFEVQCILYLSVWKVTSILVFSTWFVMHLAGPFVTIANSLLIFFLL